MTTQTQETDYEARGLARLADRERERDATAQRQHEADDAAGWQRVRDEQKQAEDVATAKLAQLRPVYELRDEAAATLAGALEAFVGLEQRLIHGLREIRLEQPFGATEAAVASSARERLQRLRRAAGLTSSHNDLPGGESLGWRLLRSMYAALRSGMLGLDHFAGPG
jgi:hypothetical protein